MARTERARERCMAPPSVEPVSTAEGKQRSRQETPERPGAWIHRHIAMNLARHGGRAGSPALPRLLPELDPAQEAGEVLDQADVLGEGEVDRLGVAAADVEEAVV